MRSGFYALLGLTFLACGESSPDDVKVNCATETRSDNIVSGLEKVGAAGQLTFRLMGTTPAPPKRPDNTWIIHLEQAGAAVDGAALAVKLYMPDHDHGTGVKPVISAAGTAGDYKVDQLNLWMPGLWELTFEATPAGGTKDQAVFRACIPE
ncbi:MAG: FixH family protein [Kofleriaceae bacterium]